MKKVFVNFKIGRGGRFNNQGHLSVHSIGKSAEAVVTSDYCTVIYENQDRILLERALYIESQDTEADRDAELNEISDDLCQMGLYTFCAFYNFTPEDFGPEVYREDASGEIVGEVSGEDGKYCIDYDGDYETFYGRQIESWLDLSDNEQAVIESDDRAIRDLERAGIEIPKTEEED